jgi:hypothetical protein
MDGHRWPAGTGMLVVTAACSFKGAVAGPSAAGSATVMERTSLVAKVNTGTVSGLWSLQISEDSVHDYRSGNE